MNRVAALFPGQGSQKVGMGADLAAAFDSAARTFERANDVLGFDLRRLAWEGPEDELTKTQNAQPAILVHSLAVWSVVEDELAPRVALAAGHSLGEFSAYAAAGALAFDDAVRLVRRRGELMSESRDGSMAAIVGLEASQVEDLCQKARGEGGVVVAANFNSPKQIVVSGEPDAVDRTCVLAKEAGARMARRLAVSGAFHSPLMKTAEEGLAAALDGIEMNDPIFPVVSNVTAQPVATAEEAVELLIRQLTSPVRWTESMRYTAESDIGRAVELGPGAVLTGLLKRMDAQIAGLNIDGPADLEKLHEVYT